MSAFAYSNVWLVLAIAACIGHIIAGEPLGVMYWFYLGACLFFQGINYIVKAIEAKERARQAKREVEAK